MNSAQKENRLGREKSPYLLQHARNPVDWFPWGPEAFEKAKKENKLIFLSIGYSTCHWCHVMEHESFENEQVAELLNAHYVSIKVDREERPDIDHIYMSAVQAMTGSGGWPLSLFLTPEAKPVTGGTYFPPDDKWGRAGMKTILPHLANLWKTEPDKMLAAGHQMAELLQAQPPVNEKQLSYEPVLQAAYKQFVNHFDEVHGGFGGAPKFPRTHDLSFLLRYWKRTGEAKALAMVEKTLQTMACGGIYDHLGGGFARYATDENWLVPHFEKMLYDQATLAQTYLEAYQATKKPFYAEVARDIFRYVLRDMTSPEGGFYSAEDADSEGEEGKFYVWRPEEIKAVLGDKAEVFNAYYGVTAQGNFEHETSILNRKPSGEISPAEFQPLREKLFEARKKRIPPHKDDKILTAWNGMMISALAKGAQILEEPLYAAKAAGAASFILEKLQDKGHLLRRFRAGESAIEAFQDDYAFFILSLVDLYEATFEVRWLEEAVRLTGQMIQMFWDPQNGGFFYTAENAETLIARTKEYYDGATPSGNSVAAFALLRLSRMTGDRALDDKAAKVIHSNSAGLEKYPVAYPQLLSDLDFALGPTREIVLAGRKESAEFRQLLKLVREDFFPNQVLLYHPVEKDEALKIEILADFIKNQKAAEGKAAAYVCRNHACELPASDPESLKKVLGRFK